MTWITIVHPKIVPKKEKVLATFHHVSNVLATVPGTMNLLVLVLVPVTMNLLVLILIPVTLIS
jgi:hypothetical protein